MAAPHPMPPLTLLLLALVATAALLGGQASVQGSITLRCDSVFIGTTASTWYQCPSTCTAWRGSAYSQESSVVGTLVYTAGSPVCLSALHAGVLQPGEEVWFQASSGPVNSSFVATIMNRVVSKAQAARSGQTILGYTITPPNPVPPAETDLSLSELIMIHNSNHQSTSYANSKPLVVACLPNTPGKSLFDTRFHQWNYASFPLTHKDVTKLQQTTEGVQIEDYPFHNSRVMRCLGSSPVLDITGLFGRSEDANSATRPTVTASIGEKAVLRYANNDVYLNRLPKNEWARHPSQIDAVQLQDGGLYNDAAAGDAKVYSRLIVRACPPHRYGPSCSDWCPDCLNGGECDAATGRCVCAPGTWGRNCQDYCDGDQYGAQCHLTCTQSTLLWIAGRYTTSCSGLTFCVRDPKGCSCLPGNKPPTCDDACDSSYYGPDCSLQCNYCNRGDCDRINGRCLWGCKDTRLCSNTGTPLNLPRLRTPPTITHCSYTRCVASLEQWNENDHDGELLAGNSVTGYDLQVQDRHSQNNWTTAATVYARQFQNEIFRDFVPGRHYSFRVRVLTSNGTADPEYNLKLRETSVSTPCLESYEGLNVIVKERTQTSFVVAGMNDESCSSSIEYRLAVKNWDDADVIKNTTSTNSEETLTGLRPNTTYAIFVDKNWKSITTLPQRPLTPEKVEIDTITSSTAWARWKKPERAEQYITTLQSLRSEGCTDFQQHRPKLLYNRTEESLYLSDLNPYERYDVCVVAANEGGQSVERCEQFVTLAQRAPAVTLSSLTCTPHQKQMTCFVTAPDDCERLNGPEPTLVWTLRGAPSCDESLGKTAGFSATYKPGWSKKIFYNLSPMVNYTVEVFVSNQVGRAEFGLSEIFQTSAANAPGPVRQLEVLSTTKTVFLQWKPPCPPLAPVTFYQVSIRRSFYGDRYTDVALPLCPEQQDHFCYTRGDLTPNTNYRIRVRSCASQRGCSGAMKKAISAVNSAPGAPIIKVTGREEQSISANFTAPPYLGANASCFLAVTNEGNSLKNFTLEKELEVNAVLPYVVNDLPPSSLFLLTSRCCNTVNCSATVEVFTSTLLAPPEAISQLRVEDNTDTSATLLLPQIRAGNANISLVVLVQNITGKPDTQPANFTVHYASWKQRQPSRGWGRRSATNQRCSDPSTSVYVPGTVEQGERTFVLGTGDDNNCQLSRGTLYRVAVVAEAVLLDQTSVSEFVLSEVLITGEKQGLRATVLTLKLATGLVVLLLVSVAVAVITSRRRKRNVQLQALAPRCPIITRPPWNPAMKRREVLCVNPSSCQAAFHQPPNEPYYVDVLPERPAYGNHFTVSSLGNDATNGTNTTTINTPTAITTTNSTMTAHLDDLSNDGDPEVIYHDPPAHWYEPLYCPRTAFQNPLYGPVVLPAGTTQAGRNLKRTQQH